MGIFHWTIQIIKKSSGRSAIRAAAYRSCSAIDDEATGETHDFTHKRSLAFETILVPHGADRRLADRQHLWNASARLDKRADAQLAREINLSLLKELTLEQNVELLLGYCNAMFVSQGMVADVCVHKPDLKHGEHPDNIHAHIMLTMRRALPQGLSRRKTREWNSQELVPYWREQWAAHANAAYARHGIAERIDQRTLAAQSAEARAQGRHDLAEELDRRPQVYMSPKAMGEARRMICESGLDADAVLARSSRAYPHNAPPSDEDPRNVASRLPFPVRRNATIVRANAISAHERLLAAEAEADRERALDLMFPERRTKPAESPSWADKLVPSKTDINLAFYNLNLLSLSALKAHLEMMAAERAARRATAAQRMVHRRLGLSTGTGQTRARSRARRRTIPQSNAP